MRLVVGITGATGVIYGIRLLEVLRGYPDVETHLVISVPGRRTIGEETAFAAKDVEALAAYHYDNKDTGASIASGSFRTAGMVIAPCSIKTAGAIAACHSDSLVARAADVTLKEGRPMLLLVRETPLHLGHLRGLRAADPRVHLVRLKSNAGETAATDAGFKAARGRWVVVMDADLQHDPADIPTLLGYLDRWDAATGWRRERARGDDWRRRLAS